MEPVETKWPEGIKKTKPRRYVLSALENAKSPLSVMDIYNQIEKNGTPVWMSTIYRILELFVSEGLVTKTSVMDSDMAIYSLNQHRHEHYAICVDCHKMIALENCPIEESIPDLEGDHFRVVGHKVELYGYCRDCDKKHAQNI